MSIDLTADSGVFVADFGETVRFRVSGGGIERTITAVVNRQTVEDDTDNPFSGTRQPTMHVMVQNDASDGVTPDQVVVDQSQIEVAYALGDTARWRTILRVLRQNTGMVLLEVKS